MSNIGNKEIMSKNLIYYIERSGKTQKEIAELIDVPPSTFSAWVKAKKYPRIDKIEMLANFFGVLKSDLIEEKTMHTGPIGMADRHTEMIIDEDLNELYEDYKKLDPKKKKLLKELVHSWVETEP